MTHRHASQSYHNAVRRAIARSGRMQREAPYAGVAELAGAQDLDAAASAEAFDRITDRLQMKSKYAPVVKLVYTMDLGSISATSRGSSPLGCTKNQQAPARGLLIQYRQAPEDGSLISCPSLPGCRLRPAALR